MGMKKWCVNSFDKTLAKNLAQECDIDPITALIALSRGITNAADLEQFLSDEPVISDPKELIDIIKAAQIINQEIEKQTLIAIFGDYDCDGVVATALLYNYLKSRNANCISYIPDRFQEGYGMNLSAVEYLHGQNVGLIITVDNGIASLKEIEKAKELGIKVVVTDHHLPSDKLPPADAVVNPHRVDCPSTFKEICGAEVAFKLICVLDDKEPEELLPYFADLLATAVVADVMPLIEENRSIVKYGIEKLKTAPLTPLSAIMSNGGISRDAISTDRIAFGISPRINAAGRMGNAKKALELLCCNDMLTCLQIAGELDDYNNERQQIEKKITAEAIKIIEEKGYCNNRVIVIGGENWHHGVVGIVAARLTEKYGKPSIVLSIDGDSASGSARSLDGFHIYNAFSACSNILKKFGGHQLAGGLTLDTKDIELFRDQINKYAKTIPFIKPKLTIDCKLKPSALSVDLAEAVGVLKPFGASNPTPVFGLYGVTLQRITPIGKGQHLRLLFSKDETTFQALLFGVREESFCFAVGDILDLAVTVDTKLYNGEYNLTVAVKALRMTGTNDLKLFSDIEICDDFLSSCNVETSQILPTREEVGQIFKTISEKPILEERIKYLYINTIGYGKTQMALKTLNELGLINKNEKGFYSLVNGAQKTNLLNSKTFKLLTERSGNNE